MSRTRAVGVRAGGDRECPAVRRDLRRDAQEFLGAGNRGKVGAQFALTKSQTFDRIDRAVGPLQDLADLDLQNRDEHRSRWSPMNQQNLAALQQSADAADTR